MTNLSQTLFRIDPTEGFVSYVNTVKPYHSKILDVLVEYVYREDVTAQVTESWNWVIEFRRPHVDVMYSAGYGYRWDPTGSSAPEAIPNVKIINATSQTSSDIANSFLVEAHTSDDYQIIVADTKSNQLAFTRSFEIDSVNATDRTFTVIGDVSEMQTFLINNYVYVTDNSGSGVNTRYTVNTLVLDGDNTIVEVLEPISLLAGSNGEVHFVLPFDSIPYWPSGTTVSITSAGSLPAPLLVNEEYHFIPSDKAGYFNIATQRYPQEFEHFVNLTTLGSGNITITRTEPFVAGDPILVWGTAGGRNNGSYIVSKVTKEGDDFRIFVMQKVQRTTPIGMAYDGNIMLQVQTYSNPSYSAVANSSDIHAETYIHEELKFSFELFLSDKVASTVLENHQTFLPVSAPIATQMMVPHGYDVQFFDLGGFDGDLSSFSGNSG